MAGLPGLSALAPYVAVSLFPLSQQPDAARTLTFLTLVVVVVAIILANPSCVRRQLFLRLTTIISPDLIVAEQSWTRGIASACYECPILRSGGSSAARLPFLALVLLVPMRGAYFILPRFTPGVSWARLGAGLLCEMWFEFLKITKSAKRFPRVNHVERNG